MLCYNAKDYTINNNIFRDNSAEGKDKHSSLELRKGNYDMENVMVSNNVFVDNSTKFSINCTGSYYKNILITGNLFSGSSLPLQDEMGTTILHGNNVSNKN